MSTKLLDLVSMFFQPKFDHLRLEPIDKFCSDWRSHGRVERAKIAASFIGDDDDASVTVDQVTREIDAMVVARDARLASKRLVIPNDTNDA